MIKNKSGKTSNKFFPRGKILSARALRAVGSVSYRTHSFFVATSLPVKPVGMRCNAWTASQRLPVQGACERIGYVYIRLCIYYCIFSLIIYFTIFRSCRKSGRTRFCPRACAGVSRGSGVRQPHIAETAAECIHINLEEKGVYFCCGINERKKL